MRCAGGAGCWSTSATGTTQSDLRLARPPTPSPAPGAVIVHPGCGFAARCWPVDRYAAVARQLAGAGRPVVVTGSADQRPLATHLATAANLPDSSVLAGETTLSQLAALVADASLVVCGDTGIAHLATAYGTPSVVLFGPVSPSTGVHPRSVSSTWPYGPASPATPSPTNPTQACSASPPPRSSPPPSSPDIQRTGLHPWVL
ncbi:MAG: glycosyltransferase family 9 protein [Pseudonocardiaceae bacterium]